MTNTTTLTLIDFARGGECFTVTKDNAADAYRALYDELVRLNDDAGDCSVLIEDGFVSDGGSFGRTYDIKHDAEQFWLRLCDLMVNDDQQFEAR